MTGRSLAGLLAVLLLLGACGKGPPGPQDQITHPRTYPNR